MDTLEIATQLNEAGRFTDALKVLDEANAASTSRNARDILRAELLERVGRFGHARDTLQTLIQRRDLNLSAKSACEFVLAKIEWEEGLTGSAIERLQRSVQLASDGGDLRRRCWPAMLLLVTFCDRSGPDAVATILTGLRNDATRLGDPRILAALHSYMGQMDAKRGLFTSATWHVQRGREILCSAPNSWIEAQLEFTRTNIAVLSADHRSALKHGHLAVKLAEQSGGAACKRTSLGNLGFVFYSLGRFDEAVDCLEQAVAMLPSKGESYLAIADTLARIRLAQGRQDDCRDLLNDIESGMELPGDRLLYPHRHAMFTRALLLSRDGHIDDALAQIDRTLDLANDAKDRFLAHHGLLTKARLLQQADRVPEALELMNSSSLGLVIQAPDLHGLYRNNPRLRARLGREFRRRRHSPLTGRTALYEPVPRSRTPRAFSLLGLRRLGGTDARRENASQRVCALAVRQQRPASRRSADGPSRSA